MTETIGLVVVAAAMIAIVVFMCRGLGSPADATGGLFAGYGGTSTLSGFGGGLLASVAGATMLASTTAGAGGSASLGATLGVAYFLLTRLGLTMGIRIVSGAMGSAGFVALVVFLFAGPGCTAVPLWQRLVILGLVLVAGAIGTVGSLLVACPRIPSTLAIFGALKIAAFLAAPLGVSLVVLPVAAWVVAFAAAALLGTLSAIAPQFVIGLTAAVISVASLGVSTTVGDTCSTGPDYSDLGAIAGFAVVHLALALLTRRRRRH